MEVACMEDVVLHIQPVINCVDNSIYCAEVLIRGYKGITNIKDIFSYLDNNQEHKQFDLSVLEHALKIIKKTVPHYPVSVNICPETLEDKEICYNIINLVEKYEISTRQIIFEINEFTDFDSYVVNDNISKLHQYGYKLAIDDFGKGRTTMLVLTGNRFDIIKIDKDFTTEEEWEEKRRLLKFFCQMEQSINFDTIIEGVETPKKLQEIQELGFKNIQGYIFQKPIDINEFINKTKIVEFNKMEKAKVG